MSATGKAKSNDESFEASQLKFNAKIENFLDINVNIDHGQFFTTAEPATNFHQLFFNVSGDIITGAIGYSASVVEIASGSIDIGRTTGKYASHIIVQAETGTTDTLTDIQNFVLGYQDITIQADTGDTITISTGGTTGSDIFLGDGVSSVTLNSTEQIRLRYDIIANRWSSFIDTTSGGGGVSFPIRPPIDNRSIVSTNQAFTLSSTTGHVLKFIAAGNFDVTFTAFPANNIQQEWEVEVIQDATGGRIVNFPQVLNPPTLPTTPNNTTIVVFRTNDGGATIRVGNTVTTTAGVSALSQLTIDVTKDWQAFGATNFGNLSGVTGISGTGSGVIISGIDTYDFFQAGQSIQNKADPDGGILYDVNDLQSHIFRADGDEIARFEESAAGVFRFNLLDHSARNAKDITFDVGATNSVPGSSPGMGYDVTPSRLVINVPAGSHLGISENAVVGSTQITDNGVLSNVLTADSDLFIGILGTSPPTVTGQFTNNATDVFVFSGGASRNLSNISIVAAATTELDNLTTTSINAALLPQASATLDFGSELLPWRIGHFREIEFPVTTGAPGPSTDTQISVNTSNNMAFNNSVNGGGFLYYFEGVNKWSISATQLSGDFILLQNSLTFNNSTTNPIGDGELTRNGNAMLLQSPEFGLRSSATTTTFDIIKIDPNPVADDTIGRMRFRVDDTGVFVTYATIRTELIDVTDASRLVLEVRGDGANVDGLQIEADDNNPRVALIIGGLDPSRIQPQIGEMGYFVTAQVRDFSLAIGTSGSLEIPVLDNASPSLTALNQAFGAFDGACGYEIQDNRLYVRESSSSWSFWTRDGEVT